jgi:hypothetical protein
MEHVGIDVHKKQRQMCIVTAVGALRHQRLCTQREWSPLNPTFPALAPPLPFLPHRAYCSVLLGNFSPT